MPEPLTQEQLRQAFPEGGLFRGDVPWLLSPQPLVLNKRQVKNLNSLGNILARFYEACNSLYHAAAAGRRHEWLARLLDAGKPEWLVEAQRSPAMRQAVPRVIRPDLILTEDGWSITELDSVPGGQGVTAFLSSLYARAGWNVVGGADGMPEGFRAAHPDGASIVVSQESADYFAEMDYFAGRLGDGYECLHDVDSPDEWPEGTTVYRFFELFDTDRVRRARDMISAAVSGRVQLSPPPVPHLEEKLWLALLHMPGLQEAWGRYFRGAHRDALRQMVPHSWVVDPAPLPPQASLPWLNVNSWGEVARFSQKERRLVLKISGFDETAWGSRGVYIGHDMPTEEWEAALNHALLQSDVSPWIMQEFHAGAVIEHPYYRPETGEIAVMEGRVRLCPYYYRRPDGNVSLGGCLATIVPKEKKKIHGMKDGILVPCSCP